MDLTFIIVNYYTAGLTAQLVESIRKYISKYSYEILIADNSNDKEQEKILNSLTNSYTETFYLNDNPGYVSANNYLALKAQGHILVLINPDTLLIDNSLEKLLEYLFCHKEVGAVGPYLLNEDGSYQVSFQKFATIPTLIKEHLLLYKKDPYTDFRKINQIHECDIIKGACLIIKKDVADNLKLFDPELVMYSEEVDLCYRIKKSGKKVMYFPHAKIVHYGEKSSSQPRMTEYSTYHYYRSKLIYFRKHYSHTYAWLVRQVLYMSLVEKTIILYLIGKKNSSGIHWAVYKKLNNEFCKKKNN